LAEARRGIDEAAGTLGLGGDRDFAGVDALRLASSLVIGKEEDLVAFSGFPRHKSNIRPIWSSFKRRQIKSDILAVI